MQCSNLIVYDPGCRNNTRVGDWRGQAPLRFNKQHHFIRGKWVASFVVQALITWTMRLRHIVDDFTGRLDCDNATC